MSPVLDFRILKQLFDSYGDLLDKPVHGFDIGGRRFDFNRHRYITGVINLSSESWYKESICADVQSAVERGIQLVRDGAHVVDIGAESSLPTAQRVDAEKQKELLVPVVRQLTQHGVIVSVESYSVEVLEACAQVGAKVFNLTGPQNATEVFEVAARYDASVILCYVQGDNVREVDDLLLVNDMVPVLLHYFQSLAAKAASVGLSKIFIDPGLGFYYRNLEDGTQRVRYQIDTFLNCFRLRGLGFPVFNILPHAPDIFSDDERRQAEPFFGVLALLGGTHMVRTHEVRRVARVLRTMELYAP